MTYAKTQRVVAMAMAGAATTAEASIGVTLADIRTGANGVRNALDLIEREGVSDAAMQDLLHYRRQLSESVTDLNAARKVAKELRPMAAILAEADG